MTRKRPESTKKVSKNARVAYWQDSDGRFHRRNGPAVQWDDGEKVWYIHGQFHRENGPAIEQSDGRTEYYLFGIKIPKKKYTKKLILQMKLTRIVET